MKINAFAISLVLVTAGVGEEPEKPNKEVPWEILSPWTQLEKAIHIEEVERDPEKAAAKYQWMVDRYFVDGDRFGKRWTATALFRLAEHQGRKGREAEAKKLYRQLLGEFPDVEPEASNSRKRLGIDPSDYVPLAEKAGRIQKLEDDHWRELWNMRSFKTEDGLFLVTFEVKLDEGYANDGMAPGYKIETIHYQPTGNVRGFCSYLWKATEADRPDQPGKTDSLDLPVGIAAFGHHYRIPAGLKMHLRLNLTIGPWNGVREGGTDCQIIYNFRDQLDSITKKEMVKPTKSVTVEVSIKTLPLDDAHELAKKCSMTLPDLDEQGWQITLPAETAEP